MAVRLRAFDWAASPLGTPATWPSELKSTLSLCMHSRVASAIYWGPELRLLYNDAWAPIPAERHPSAIGQPAADVWGDIWPVVGPQFIEVLRTGEGLAFNDQQLFMMRSGLPEETFWNYSFTPIFGADGKVAGILNQAQETTDQVRTTRSQAFIIDLGDRMRDLTAGEFSASSVLSTVLMALGKHLGLARVGYSDVDVGNVAVVRGNWHRPPMPDIVGQRFQLDQYGAGPMAQMLAGSTLAFDDLANDPRMPAEDAARFAAVGVSAVLFAPVIRDGRTIAFAFLDDDKPRRWSRHDADLAREAVDRIRAAFDRAESAARLRESEQRFAAIFGQAAVGLSEVDVSGRFMRVNESMGRLLGRSMQEIGQLRVSDVTYPDDMPMTRLAADRAIHEGEPLNLEKRYVRPDGSVIWANTNSTLLRDGDGRPTSFFSITTDVSERKEQDRIRSWLLAELNHRVKNSLSTVQALVHQTRMTTTTVEEFEAVFSARLMALSRAHDLLMRETWASAALRDLLSETLAPHTVEGERRIIIDGPEVRLSPTAAVTLNLAFHELATNAAKFGALSSPVGRIEVEWAIDADRRGVELNWRESDGPPVSPPTRRGFGVRLLQSGAPRELGGSATLKFDPEGFACAIHIPLSQKVMIP